MAWNNTVALIIWLSGPLMEALLLMQAQRRRLWHLCPVFFAYTAFQIVKFGVLFSLRASSQAYFVAYWIGELVDVGLVVAVLYQLFSQLFSGYEALRRLQDALFRWSAAVCILVAVVAAASVPGSEASQLKQGLLAFALGAAVLKAGLIIFLMIVSSALALRWGHYAFAVLVGMGVYNSVDIVTTAVRLQVGAAAAVPYGLIKAGAYTCALLVWVWYFFSKEHSPERLRSIPQNDLVSWNEALMQLLMK
jgi:uncharacterized membrane protein YhaH (DUF805 family)